MKNDRLEEEGTGEYPMPNAKRARGQHHPWQRRKLKVPSENDGEPDQGGDDLMDVYQGRASLINPLPYGRPRRPWPSSQILSSTIATRKKETAGFTARKSPFLQSFYKSIGMAVPVSSEDPREKLLPAESGNATGSELLEDIDNPAFSMLNPFQHRRYLKLVQQTERRTPSERGHWKQLRAVVPAEQAKYKNAVQQFWTNHREDRVLFGFKSLSAASGLGVYYCQWACAENRRRNERLLGQLQDGFVMPMVFGKCRQVLSLRSSAINNNELLDVTTLDMKMILEDGDLKNLSLVASEKLAVGSRIQAPSTTLISKTTTRLQDDPKAIQLAAHHKVDMVTTDETLETLLCIPGDTTTRWILLATSVSTRSSTSSGKGNDVIVLEDPLAQAYTTPRECLTRGIQEGLYQQATTATPPDRNNDGTPATLQQQQYVYTVWTLPVAPSAGTARRSQKTLKVLIRSMVRLQGNWEPGIVGATDTTDPVPLKIRVHVEYFPERGQELLSRYERSLWILDQVLWQHAGVPKIDTKLCRVDGRKGTILEWQETSVAHAFAADEGGEGDNPMQGFAQLLQFFQAVSTIDFQGGGEKTNSTMDSDTGERTPSQTPTCRLLCLPSREATSGTQGTTEANNTLSDPYSVSVHVPYLSNARAAKPATDQDFTVNLQPIIENADGVMLSSKATQECHRPWKWDIPDRIPYTFPTEKMTTSTATLKK